MRAGVRDRVAGSIYVEKSNLVSGDLNGYALPGGNVLRLSDLVKGSPRNNSSLKRRL